MKSHLMRIFIAGLLVLAVCSVQAQQSQIAYNKKGTTYQNNPIDYDNNNHSEGSSGSAANPDINANSEGDAYLLDEWKDGYVVLKDKSRIDELKLRYNVYHHQMQFIHEGDTLAFSDPEEISFFMFDNNKMIYTDYILNGELAKDFFVVLHEGENSLIQRNLVKFHEASDPSDPRCTEDVYVKCCELYLQKQNEPATKINCSKKGVLYAFSDKKDEVKAYMKTNKLSVKDRSELLEILEFYNSL